MGMAGRRNADKKNNSTDGEIDIGGGRSITIGMVGKQMFGR